MAQTGKNARLLTKFTFRSHSGLCQGATRICHFALNFGTTQTGM